MARNRPKLFRLTPKGLRLVKEALIEYDSLSAFCEAKNGVHRGTFTKFYDGDGMERETIENYFSLLEIPNWLEDWKEICELLPDRIEDWTAYDDRWVGRKQLISSLTKKLRGSCRLLLLLGITGIGKTALSECIADRVQTRFSKILRINFDNDEKPKDFASSAERWSEELGYSLLIQDKQPTAILARLIDHLQENRVLVLIDSLEAILAKNEEYGWGDFEDEWWGKFFAKFLAIESCESSLIVTSQDVPAKIEALASRYPTLYHREILGGLADDEQIALFEKAGLDVRADSQDRALLMRIAKVYHGHPLTLRVVIGDIVQSFGKSAVAFWEHVGGEIKEVETALAEAEAGAKLEGADDDWKLHKLTREIRLKVYKQRLEAVFRRLEFQNTDAYLLICVAAKYRRPVQDSGWLRQLEVYVKRLRKETYDKEQQQKVLDELCDRFLVEISLNHNSHRVLGLHNLIRSVALEHRKDLFKKWELD
ncbi:ATP-binding protein [Tumidithrix elongata RA019]|uniref:ATP-binding protein n=1 Tax=Tumidithrix elongata BACA0141 TaxID=2716417 RepID=A0AAW9PZI2_9CYAN|nr:ATP-binding protein [Tumidithrix elongata RA019]